MKKIPDIHAASQEKGLIGLSLSYCQRSAPPWPMRAEIELLYFCNAKWDGALAFGVAGQGINAHLRIDASLILEGFFAPPPRRISSLTDATSQPKSCP